MIRKNIGIAGADMQQELVELWMEAFGDAKDYVEFYFQNRFPGTKLLVYMAENRPVSMLSLLPAELCLRENQVAAQYVYAVATKEAYRGRGYARELIHAARELTGEPLLLEPADERLAEYYRRMGFRDAFTVWEYDLKIQENCMEQEAVLSAAGIEENIGNCKEKQQRYWLLTITPTEYATLRNQHFTQDGYVKWDKEAISYALLENELQGGYAYKVFHDEQEDILLYRMENDCMKIIETTLTDEGIYGVLEKLRMRPEKVHIRRPAYENTGSKRVLGMILSDEQIENGYLNLTLE